MNIRFAAPADARALLEIYAQYIDTPITFECALPTSAEFAGRIAGITQEYPYLVWEEAGKIAGYAYAHRQRERSAYQWNAELSVYLDGRAIGKGIGRRLYGALMDILRAQEIRTVYGAVTMPNEKSERLHLALGFTLLGVYHSTGYKAGAWHDVAWFEKQIAPYGEQPVPFRPINRIPADRLQSIIGGINGLFT